MEGKFIAFENSLLDARVGPEALESRQVLYRQRFVGAEVAIFQDQFHMWLNQGYQPLTFAPHRPRTEGTNLIFGIPNGNLEFFHGFKDDLVSVVDVGEDDGTPVLSLRLGKSGSVYELHLFEHGRFAALASA